MIDKLISLIKPDVSPDVKLTGVSLFFAKVLEKHNRRLDLMETKILIPLKDGEKGDKGDIGKSGKDGLNGKDGKDGLNGKDGVGKDGKQGKDGVSVVDAEIAVDDHLVIKLSNGKEIDAGELPKADIQHIISSQLPNNQIYVSPTPPSNPSINDLWLQI